MKGFLLLCALAFVSGLLPEGSTASTPSGSLFPPSEFDHSNITITPSLPPNTTTPSTTTPKTTTTPSTTTPKTTTTPSTTTPKTTTTPSTTTPKTTTTPSTTTPKTTTTPSTTPPKTTTAPTTPPKTTTPSTTPSNTTTPSTTTPKTTTAPTTPPKTTAAPTTPPKTTAAPTTPPKTTAAPTTPPKTTAAPTTPPKTTAAPTTPPKTTTAPTTPPKTTTPTPTTIPQPTKVANLTVGTYTLKGEKGLCLRAQMALEFRLVTDKANGTFIVQPSMTEASGKCEATKAELKLAFTEGSITLSFNKSEADKMVYVDAISFDLSYPFTSAGNQKFNQKNNSLHLFAAATGYSYSCKSESLYMGSGLYLDVTQDQMQAFNLVNDQDFGKPQLCPADKPDYRVAIAVGVVLLVLIVIVLIAYLLGRRKRTSGYQSL